MPLTIYLQILSSLGILISIYFVLTYHGFTLPSSKLIPIHICSKGTCHNILKTRFSNVFKVPNFYLGLIYYLVVFFSTFFVLEKNILFGFLIVSWLVVLFSIYLVYALIFKLKTNCNLCFTAQVINLLIGIFYGLMLV